MDDLSIIKEILRGDSDKFSLIIKKYEGDLQRFIYSILKNREQTADVAQETFITAYNKLYTYNRESKFKSWLFTIARNRCIDYLRKEKKVVQVDIDSAFNLSSKELSPEDSAEVNETKIYLKRFLKELDETDRQILYLKTREEATFLQISRILDINESTVKKKFYKIRERFKEYAGLI